MQPHPQPPHRSLSGEQDTAYGAQMRSMPTDVSRRNAQLVRILHILRDLERLGGVAVDELALRYGTTPRTIRRDFAALEEAGLPLQRHAGEGPVSWSLGRSSGSRHLARAFDAGHFLALKAAEAQSGVARSMPALLATLEDLAGKIETALGPKGRQQLADIEACFYSYDKHGYNDAPPDVLWPLIEAIANRRLCRVTYRSPKRQGEATHFEVLPLKLFIHQHAPYLMGHIYKYNTVGSLNLQRLVAIEVLPKTGQVPEHFDPNLLENAAFGIWRDGPPTAYSLLFDAEIAPYILERRWHPSQTFERHDDGTLTLAFCCHASVEVEAWVASWRQHVTVLAPTTLREQLAALGAALTHRYQAPSPQLA